MTTERLRILHVITRLDKGGSAENTMLTALGNAAHGHHVSLICGISDIPQSETEERARESGISIIRFNTLVREISPFKDLWTLFRIYLHLKLHPCDVLHTHTSKAGIIARIAGKTAGVKCIIHTPHGHIFYGYFSPAKTRFLTTIERMVTRKTAAVITLTQHERSDYLDRNIGTPDSVYPVFSGIEMQPYLEADYDRAATRRELGIPRDCYLAGTVARLVHIKNQDLTISAAQLLKKSHPDIYYLFVGDGDMREHLEQRIASLGLRDRFIFTGWRNDIPRMLHAIDLYIMCSHNEGMGRAFVEAQACGLPVIGSRVGGIPEVLVEGETGYLVSPTDHEALAESITRWYNRRHEREEIARRCREWVNPRFSIETMVQSIETLFYKYTSEQPATGRLPVPLPGEQR
jgi:glycosyltransferase involved in cell wall biosynthesis